MRDLSLIPKNFQKIINFRNSHVFDLTLLEVNQKINKMHTLCK